MLSKSPFSILRLTFNTLKCPNSISTRLLSSNNVNKSNSEDDKNEKSIDAWFSMLANKKETPLSQTVTGKNSIANIDPETKRKIIIEIYEKSKQDGYSVPTTLTEKIMEELMHSVSKSHIYKSLRYFNKQEYYQEKKNLSKQKKKSEYKNIMDQSEENTYSGYCGSPKKLCSMLKLNKYEFFQQQMCTSIINDGPKVVFDFRFTGDIQRLEVLKSLYNQMTYSITCNRKSIEPFEFYFCNYDYNNMLHQKHFDTVVNSKWNMITHTTESYMDIFPQEDLIYLTNDAKEEMKCYDPSKVYIIGVINDKKSPEEYKLATYKQAKKDKIKMLRFPIEKYISNPSLSKNFTINSIFQILLHLYNNDPKNLADAIRKSMPPRLFFKYLKKKYHN